MYHGLLNFFHHLQMNFDQLIQLRALSFKSTVEGSGLDALTDKALASNPEFKNVCALISVELFDRFTNILSVLEISKRRFIEAAIVEALDKADAIIKQVDPFENVRDAPEDSKMEGV